MANYTKTSKSTVNLRKRLNLSNFHWFEPVRRTAHDQFRGSGPASPIYFAESSLDRKTETERMST